jgi:nucleoside-diphosphate-sugar epimerase
VAKFLVTGGAGFIGSNLVDALVADGNDVRVLDDLSTGRLENLAAVRDRIELIEGSITDPSLVARAMRGVDYVFHEAALASVPQSIADPVRNHEVNVNGTVSLLLAARENGVKRFVLASSAAIYGDGEASPKLESFEPEPVSPYASAKLIGEVYCRQFSAGGWLPTVCLRYFNIFGPRQDPGSDYAPVVPIFIQCRIEGRPATIYGDGGQTRDFTYVDNVVRANLRAIESKAAVGGVFNIGCGAAYSVNDLHDRIAKSFGTSEPAQYEPTRAGDVRASRASIDRAREVLGYEPIVSFEDGLDRTCAWFREHTDALVRRSRS